MLAKITCPHCWYVFQPHDTLWVAAHPALLGDLRLGESVPTRFLPSRFAPNGAAIDAMGAECTHLACPSCHLTIPRLCFEYQPWFVSIVGAPGSGKSYYLAAALHQLRRNLPDWFKISFTDADAEFNQLVNRYEEQLFGNYNAAKPTALAQLVYKTQIQDLSNFSSVRVGGQEIRRPRPFLFSIRPQSSTDKPQALDQSSRVMCLYDNPGEVFQAGQDSALLPVTEHLAKARLLLFLFDPTLHSKFRERITTEKIPIASDVSRDPGARLQHLILTEMANRTRRYANLAAGAKHDKPLVVIVTKKDLWGPALMKDLAGGSVVLDHRNPTNPEQSRFLLRLDRIEEHSRRLRQILVESAREIVEAAEGFASHVIYLGVSALGKPPKQDQATKSWAIAPQDIQPDWADVPILYGLHKTVPNLIVAGRTQAPTKAGPKG